MTPGQVSCPTCRAEPRARCCEPSGELLVTPEGAARYHAARIRKAGQVAPKGLS